MEASSEGSPNQTLCIIQSADFYPKPEMEKEEEQLTVPFPELPGESVIYLGRTDDGVLALSNYRIFLLKNSTNSETSVPLGLIETAQSRDLFHLVINCKDASTAKCSFETAEQCSGWQQRITQSICLPKSLDSLFAFRFYSWTNEALANSNQNRYSGGSSNDDGGLDVGTADQLPLYNCSALEYSERFQRTSSYEDDFDSEVKRLGYFANSSWRISKANENFKLCPSYPKKILVPSCIPDDMLLTVANFRGSRRLPAIVWRHRKSCAVIARCSQPEVGWLGWRNAKDEQLLKAIADACAFDRSEQMAACGGQTLPSGGSSPSSPDSSHEEVASSEVRKVLIVDARSYTSAVTNRARGGGCECIEYYPCAEIEFMNLGNIHAIRKSFHALRQLCASPPDVPNWLGLLEKTMWLQHLSGLLTAAMTVCHAVEKQGRPVLVHCSDGWDRTPQIVATAQLCLDPFYRTVEGFRILVEREWLSYGHKFADRCGHGPGSDELNERCPVFLQWLDLVQQIHKQFPCSFEFSMAYLIKLAQHSLSSLFGTFLCNTLKERLDNAVFEHTFSVWPFLFDPIYKNPLYVSNKEKVLWPAHNVRDLCLWTEVYLGSLGNQNSADFPSNNIDGLHNSGSMSPMIKTRSYGDLINADIQNGTSRRSSDPNMSVDPNLTIDTNSENESNPDVDSENIMDYTSKLQNLTIELNHHDKEPNKVIYDESSNEANDKNEFEIENLKIASQQFIQQEQTKQETNASETMSNVNIPLSNGNSSLISTSPQINNNLKQGDCDLNTTSTTATYSAAREPLISTHHQNGLNEISNATLTANEETVCNSNGHQNATDNCSKIVNGGTAGGSTITIHKTSDMNLDLMQSVELKDCEPTAFLYDNNSDNIWHGSVTTSTDTLVPIESRSENALCASAYTDTANDVEGDVIDGRVSLAKSMTIDEALKNDRKIITNSSKYNNLPKVHSGNNIRSNVQMSKTSSSNTSSVASSTSSSLNNLNNINLNVNEDNININTNNPSQIKNTSEINTNTTTFGIGGELKTYANENQQCDSMEESILILPEHQKLEISFSGKCETVESTTAATHQAGTTSASNLPPFSAANASTQRRRRTSSSSNSRCDAFGARPNNGSTLSQFSLPGVRSLPMTPPGLIERPQVAISCPDGLAHALSEQNIRLQQIVNEHKLREDELKREIHNMRMELLRKTCPNCTNAPATNDEQCSALDNLENSSICSWEAVEDRSGPSSFRNLSSLRQPASSVRWVPDHAVSRCTSCQIEFWLGRRKHHCRSCGQIFCADCSEFWAPLPDEKLFHSVRLCGPCYHSVTTRMQQQSRSYIVNSNTNNSNSHSFNGNMPINTLLMMTSAPAPSSMEQANVNANAAVDLKQIEIDISNKSDTRNNSSNSNNTKMSTPCLFSNNLEKRNDALMQKEASYKQVAARFQQEHHQTSNQCATAAVTN